MVRNRLSVEAAIEKRRPEHRRGDPEVLERAKLPDTRSLGATKHRHARCLDEILDESKRGALESVRRSAMNGESAERH